MILDIILVLLIVALAVALYFQIKASNKQTEEGQRLLKDYERRVNEQEKLLNDYHALEKNFDSVGQGYEQALLAFDKMEEEKQGLTNTINTLRNQVEQLQQKLAQPSNSLDAGEPFDVSDNITVSDLIDKAVKESGIDKVNYLTFAVEAADDVKQMMILTSEPHLTRALSSVLNNAAKFTTDGSVRLTVTPESDKLKFAVEDTGMGVPAEEAEHIFEPFAKLNSYFDGAGIGLTIARSIARRLNGDLTLDTAFAGPGARFVLTLPL